MQKQSQTNDQVPGVGCDVNLCKYHSKENMCHADHIKVANKVAVQKSETYCSTFAPKEQC